MCYRVQYTLQPFSTFLMCFFVGGNSCLLSNNYFYIQDASLLKKMWALLIQLGKKYFLQLQEKEGDTKFSELKDKQVKETMKKHV